MLHKIFKPTSVVISLLFYFLVMPNALAVDATYNSSSNILEIPALQINDDLLSVSLLLGNDGCFSVLSTENATRPFTGATYNLSTLTATLPTVKVDQNIFQANIQFSNGCFRAMNVIDITTTGSVDGQLVCRDFQVGQTQTFTETTETVLNNGVTTDTDEVIEIVSSTDSGNVVISLQNINGESNEALNMIDLDAGQQIFVGALFDDGLDAVTFSQTTRVSSCPLPAIGSEAIFNFTQQGQSIPFSSLTVTTTTIVSNIIVSTPLGEFVTTRHDTTAVNLTSGVSTTTQLSSFFADGIGEVRQIQISETSGVKVTVIKEITSSSFGVVE